MVIGKLQLGLKGYRENSLRQGRNTLRSPGTSSPFVCCRAKTWRSWRRVQGLALSKMRFKKKRKKSGWPLTIERQLSSGGYFAYVVIANGRPSLRDQQIVLTWVSGVLHRADAETGIEKPAESRHTKSILLKLSKWKSRDFEWNFPGFQLETFFLFVPGHKYFFMKWVLTWRHTQTRFFERLWCNAST